MTSRQTDLLHILNTEPLLLKSFLHQTKEDLARIDKLLSLDQDSKSEEEIYRIAHSIKGNAGLLDFRYMAAKAHEFEDVLKSLRYHKHERSFRVTELRAILKEITGTVETLGGLVDRIADFNKKYNEQSTKAGKLIVQAIGDLIDRINHDMNRDVVFDHSNFDQDAVPAGDFLFFKDILTQLTRNAMVHGIESAEERKKQKKPTPPTISLSSEIVDNRLILHFADNGRGLQIEKIRAVARDRRLLPEEKIRKMSDRDIAELIYTPGLSTTDNPGLLAGRGIGMNLIRQKIQERQGEIRIDSETGKYCIFNITAPLA
jgi:two-component system chemotaxis sensor kinase CheA